MRYIGDDGIPKQCNAVNIDDLEGFGDKGEIDKLGSRPKSPICFHGRPDLFFDGTENFWQGLTFQRANTEKEGSVEEWSKQNLIAEKLVQDGIATEKQAVQSAIPVMQNGTHEAKCPGGDGGGSPAVPCKRVGLGLCDFLGYQVSDNSQ